jgi:NodT family efflux transporter outer membrane factor (OMF) lipoprotein
MTIMTPARRCLPVAAAALLAACTVGPDYHPPDPADSKFTPAAWHDPAASGPTVSEQSDPDPTWWTRFNDPVLTTLITRSIAGNLDLRQALLRVVEARQSVLAASAAGLPSLNGTGSYMREQVGLKGILESKGAYSGLNSLADSLAPLDSTMPGLSQSVASGGPQFLNQLSQPINLFQYGLDASWELDLFGRVRRSVEQAKAQTAAQAEAANDSLVVLESDVAQSYIQFRGAQALTAAQQENIRAATDALNLTQRSQQKGLTTDLDVEQARTQLDDSKRQLPGYEKQQLQAMNALSVLTGQPPGALDAMLAAPGPLPPTPAVIDVGLPASLARRRPDIRQAEAQLHAATAGIGVAVASFYPDISLTGNLGIRAVDASYLTNWASHFYSAGPSVSLPIFQGGRLTANLRMARAQAAEAALHYRATVLNALREVEDDLVAYRTDRAARDQLVDTVRSADLSFYLAKSRYTHGLSDFIQVLDAERTLTTDRQQLVQAEITLADDVIALYRAVGGGWQDGPAPAPTVDTSIPITPAALDAVAAGP